MEYSYNIQDLPAIAKTILKASSSKLFLLYGEMGVGKTTLIKELAKELGVVDEVTSPTYSIVNQYKINTNLLINHIDCYRIKTFNEALSIGIEEYLNNRNFTFIEWPQVIIPLLPQAYTKLIITNQTNGSRTLQIVPIR